MPTRTIERGQPVRGIEGFLSLKREDPQRQTFTVLKPAGGAYAEHGVFRPDETGTSARPAGVTIDVPPCPAAGRVSRSHSRRRR